MYSSIPIGFFFAAITKRLSIVEGLAGEVGYEEEKSSETRSSK